MAGTLLVGPDASPQDRVGMLGARPGAACAAAGALFTIAGSAREQALVRTPQA